MNPSDKPAERLRFSLITGALGSGKTTLLNAMLRTSDLSEAFVLVNEFGAIGIDHALIAEVTEKVVLLESGCACCAVTGDLKDELTKIVDQVMAGTWRYGRHVILETTGLADPLPILQLINSDEVLRDHYVMGRIMTAFDTLRHYDDASADPAYESQIALADVLVLTKVRMASASDNKRARQMIEHANPLALAVEYSGGDAGSLARRLIGGNHLDREDAAPELHHPHNHSHEGHHHHLEGVTSFALTIGSEVARADFLRWLQLFSQASGEDLLRLKGSVPFIDGWHDVNGYGTVLHSPLPVVGRDYELPGRLVVIARGLDPAAVQRGLDWACLGQRIHRQSDLPTEDAQVSVITAPLSEIRALLSPERVSSIPQVLRWNLHNPWSIAGMPDLAWPLLDILEGPDMVAGVAKRCGANLNLLSSEILTPQTHWLGLQGGCLIADEGSHVAVPPRQCWSVKVPLWGLPGWHDETRCHDLTAPVGLGPAGEDWAVLSVIFADALEVFDRSADHPAHRQRGLDRPLEPLATAPIWHVAGARHPATNYVRGFARPMAEWVS